MCSALLATLESIPTGGASSSAVKTTAPANSPATAATAAAAAYVPPVDRTPPKLRLLGDGTAALTQSGAALMIDNVTWNSVWADPGATAVDAVDGNITARIQRLGVGGWLWLSGRRGCQLGL
jgi:hypothetical protein